MKSKWLFAAAALALAGCNQTGKPDPAMTRLADRIAVEDLITDYYEHFGGSKNEDFARYYTDDASFDVNGLVYKGHQEIVKGPTVELSGPHLALVELGHWYENVLLMGLLALFLAPWGWAVTAAGLALCYGLEVLVDNSSARLRWEHALRSSWLVGLVLGAGNVLLLHQLLKGGRP